MPLSARPSRIAGTPTRLAVLAALVVGHLPVPVVHAHGTAGDDGGPLARHLALFHGDGGAVDPARPHVHLVPALFFAGGDAGDATGDDAPGPDGNEPVPLEIARAGDPTAGAPLGRPARPLGPAASPAPGPRHFLETFSAATDLGGLIGVCLR